jgi:hypothetical protein
MITKIAISGRRCMNPLNWRNKIPTAQTMTSMKALKRRMLDMIISIMKQFSSKAKINWLFMQLLYTILRKTYIILTFNGLVNRNLSEVNLLGRKNTPIAEIVPFE